jgi:pimeloyl-ACP methyl ester carboxylesterase
MNPRATYRDPALGPARELELPSATIRVHERGSGHPIVFVHGLLVNANLYRGRPAAGRRLPLHLP